MTILTYISILFVSLSTYAQSSVEIGGCTGTIFKMPGMKSTDNALVLTNGHCIPMEFPTNKESSSTKEVFDKSGVETVFIYNSDLDLGKPLFLKNLIYASMKRRDIAVAKLDKSYDELERSRYPIYEIAPAPPAIGETLSFHSFYKQKRSLCQVEQVTPILKEAVFTTANALRLKATPECQLEHGNSGTAGIKDNMIYAVVFTRYDGSNKACALNNPCEIFGNQASTAKVGQAYAFPTHFLHQCYNEASGKFDFTSQVCQEAM